MTKVYEFLAEGFEELEALAPVDVLRRADVPVQTVSVTGEKTVCSSHGVQVVTDLLFEDHSFKDADLLLLPGGMPGASHLNDHEGLRQLLLQHVGSGKRVGAICAAPMVLGTLGLLQGRRATCAPGFEQHLKGAQYTSELVTEDGPFITAKGAAASLPYAYRLLALFRSEEEIHEMQRKMQYLQLIGK